MSLLVACLVVPGCAPSTPAGGPIVVAVGPGLAEEAGRVAAAFGQGAQVSLRILSGENPLDLVRGRTVDVVIAAAQDPGGPGISDAALPAPVVELSPGALRAVAVGRLPLVAGMTAFGRRPPLTLAQALTIASGTLPDWPLDSPGLAAGTFPEYPDELLDRGDFVGLAGSGDLRASQVALVRLADLGPAVAGLAVDGIRPTPETVRSGRYALSVPVVALWAGNLPSFPQRMWAWLTGALRPEVAGFVRWLSSGAGQDAFLGVGDLVTLVAVGDVMLDRGVARRVASLGPDYPFEAARELLLGADLTVCNLESPPATGGTPVAGKEIWFRASPRAAEALVAAGFDLVSLANNHSLDYGRGAFCESLAILDALGVAYCGGGLDEDEARAPKVLERGGVRLAFLGYSEFAELYWSADRFSFVAGEGRPGVAPLRRPTGVMTLDAVKLANPEIAADIAQARRIADLVVVSVHWGTEYRNEPDRFQLLAGRALLDAGADLVLGHHPHTIQGLAAPGRGLVAFSLGNFVFDQTRAITTESMILRVEASRAGIFSWEAIPVRIVDCQPRPAQGSADGEEIAAKILRLSVDLLHAVAP